MHMLRPKSEHNIKEDFKMAKTKVYQYLFHDNDTYDFFSIHGTDLYEVNKRAYTEYCTYFPEGRIEDDFGNPKQTFVEFCKYYASGEHNAYGGASFDWGCLDIKRDDFEVETC